MFGVEMEMSRKLEMWAKLPGYQGPVPALEEVVAAFERARFFNGLDLAVAGVDVVGGRGCRRATTSDRYTWFCVLDFVDKHGSSYALAVPWPHDHDNKHGSRFDRLPVMYWQGTYDQPEVARLVKEFVAAFEGVACQKQLEVCEEAHTT